MKAAIYYGAKDIRCEEIADPELDAHHEILVKVSGTSICGSDLHVYGGALESIMAKGKSQTGHELIGNIVECGKDVNKFTQGDRVTMAYSCSCGSCHMCEIGQTAHCETTNKAVYGFGSAFGNLNGTHAEYIRIPYADGHAHKVPEQISDAEAVTLSCNLPSALIGNQLADIQRGENVAIVGCGPTGLMALDIATHNNPAKIVAFDRSTQRLQMAAKRGAIAFDINEHESVNESFTHTKGRGFDKVIEVVGSPEALQSALDLVRPGGTIAAIGVFSTDTFNLNLADVFLRDISLHMNGFANVQPFMINATNVIEKKWCDIDGLFTHEFALQEIDQAYATFYQQLDGVAKVMVRP